MSDVVTDATFENEVLRADRPVLVDFWATWCVPCKMLSPILEQIGTERPEQIKIVKLDVDANPQTRDRYGVRAMPTMILFKNGNEAPRLVGFQPKARLINALEPHLRPS